ncbi:hypothetical protein [sulfur-oxidizing endosymbiont of Gigantopelta aegis]|uniref:hypothetical protein n=1 Tax=sulfur-oxidizing endosymbiont of Gigantopelta aegis TaxID=2794934 RepID=UPI0018DB15BC|nr:hypothetical protein [sulfur-oxidizing endosymbiont of Gigantopelta aegis]
MEKYYIIADVDKSGLTNLHDNKWPKLIGYSFEKDKILIMEGRGHGLQGTKLSINKFKSNDWIDVFNETDSSWFIKFISEGLLNNDDNKKLLKNEIIKRGELVIKSY